MTKMSETTADAEDTNSHMDVDDDDDDRSQYVPRREGHKKEEVSDAMKTLQLHNKKKRKSFRRDKGKDKKKGKRNKPDQKMDDDEIPAEALIVPITTPEIIQQKPAAAQEPKEQAEEPTEEHEGEHEDDDSDDDSTSEKRKIDRVIYARKAGEEFGGFQVENGEKISLEDASQLKELAWGSANMPPKGEWLKQGIVLNPPEQIFAYGVKAPRNGCRNFMMCLQAFFLKHLLFEKKGRSGGSQKRFRRYREDKKDKGQSEVVQWAQLLKPNEKAQAEMVVGGISEVLNKVAEGKDAVFCLPGPENCFEPTAHYGIDGVTEKLRLFKCKKEEELKGVLRRYVGSIMQEQGVGLLCILYSLMLSRGADRMKEDMQDQAENSLVDPMGDCTQALLNLIVLGRATPYVHNGAVIMEDEEAQMGVERIGVIGRNDIGFLLWDKDMCRTEKWQLGSRLKTPTLPMWVTKVNDQYGVLFNPNKELMRSYHAENRFQLYYYANAEFKKDERKETVLTIDTRQKTNGQPTSNNLQDDGDLDDSLQEPPLQLAIKTKWEGADINWHGIAPYVS